MCVGAFVKAPKFHMHFVAMQALPVIMQCMLIYSCKLVFCQPTCQIVVPIRKTYNCSMFELCVRAHPIYPIQVAGTSIPHMKTLMAGSCLLIFGIDNQYIDRPLLVEMTLLIQNANISQVWSFRSALPLACQVQDIGDASEQAGESSQVRSGCSEPQLWLPWLVV